MHDGEQGLTREQLHERLRGKAGLVVLLGDRIDKDAIDAGEALRVVANVAVGYDNLDVAYAVSKGIAVTNTPDVLTDATADMTWALILAVTRRLGEGERIVRGGRWRGWAFDFMLGSSLAGKQLGIVGGGRIGRAVAARAGAFGMHVAVHSRRGVDWPDATAMGLDQLLATSDIVSLHVPLDARDETFDRPEGAGADEADRVSRQHRSRPGRGRSRPRVGAPRAADRRGGARRVRARAARP